MTAEKLLEWCSGPDNQTLFGSFASDLTLHLNNCFKLHPSVKRTRELMWEALFKLRSSPHFILKWTDFLKKSIDVAPSPIFFQFVVDCVFEVLMKNLYQLDVQQKEQFDVSLTYEEENALRYTAGYVVKAVLKKLKRSTNPMKKELCRYAMELNTNDGSEQESEDWTALVDRGGLTHIGDMTYGVFHSMELEVKLFFGRQPYIR